MSWRRLALDYARGDAMLEIGFGTGELLIAARKRGLTVVGLERSPAMQRQARKKLRAAGCMQPFLRGDVRHMPFAPRSFDTILATFPAEFILQAETWRELHRLLRPGGASWRSASSSISTLPSAVSFPGVRPAASPRPNGRAAGRWRNRRDSACRSMCGARAGAERRCLSPKGRATDEHLARKL